MLTQIYIKKFLYFQDVLIELDRGLNIFTGETGAGKSLILDAIEFVLGKRGNYEDGTFVELTFQVESEHSEEGTLILAREVKNTKQFYYINGRKTVRSLVSQIAQDLIEIHGQHENQKLLKREFQRELLDKFCEVEQILKHYQKVYSRYTELSEKLKKLKEKQADRLRTIDFLSYQIKEIESLNLRKGEKEELEREYSYLKNIQAIKEAVYKSIDSLGERILPELKAIEKSLSKVCQYSDKLTDINNQIQEANTLLEESYRTLRSFEVGNDYEIVKIEERLNQINSLERKYNTDSDGLIEMLGRLKEDLHQLENLEYDIPHLQEEVARLEVEVRSLAEDISNVRREKSTMFSKEVMEHLSDLGFLSCEFKVQIEEKEIDIYGKDRIEFLFSANRGFQLKPLGDVASGGEISRLSLALKLVSKKSVPTMIFDEIDTGIGGKTAVSMARKLKDLAGEFQIILITHLPQIAALSDNHYHVEKRMDGEKTTGIVRKLNMEDKIKEIARMLKGDTDRLSLEYAREFIQTIG